MDRAIAPTYVKETIVLESMPTFDGDTFVLSGRVETNENLDYTDLHVFDAAGAIDHFAELQVNPNKSWEIRLRRAWLEGRVFPVYVDPTLTVAGHDIHLYNVTTTCFPPSTLIRMDDGSTKMIADVEIGDRLKGGEAYGVMRFRGSPLYDYRGVLVSAEHLVKHGGQWMTVFNALGGDASPVAFTTTNWLLQTMSGRMWVVAPDGEEIEFSAFEGAPSHEEIEETYQAMVIEYLTETDG